MNTWSARRPRSRAFALATAIDLRSEAPVPLFPQFEALLKRQGTVRESWVQGCLRTAPGGPSISILYIARKTGLPMRVLKGKAGMVSGAALQPGAHRRQGFRSRRCGNLQNGFRRPKAAISPQQFAREVKRERGPG